MVGLAGEGQNFDGNGMYVRFQTGGGAQQVSLGQGNAGSRAAVRRTCRRRRSATGPRYPGKVPPYVDDQPCYKQKLPDLNGPAAARTPPLPTGGADDRRAHGRRLALTTLRSRPAVRHGGRPVTAIRKHLVDFARDPRR